MNAFTRPAIRVGLLIVVAAWCASTAAAGQEAHPAKGQPADIPPGKIRGPSDQVSEIIVRGRLLRNCGKYDPALAEFEKALETAQLIKDRPGEAWSLSNIATVYRYRAEKVADNSDLIKTSADHYEKAANIARENADKHNEAYATLYLGVLAAMRKEPAEALKRYAVAMPLFEAEGDRYYVGRTYAYQARALLEQRLFDKGMESYEKSLSCLREARMFNEVTEILGEMQVAYKKFMQP
jgi:tetratricopeptide (TPR) repeat protein